MAYGVSLDHMAFSDLKCYSFQPGHRECTAEKWRSRQPVWIFCCLPPTAQTCQKEPVSESKTICKFGINQTFVLLLGIFHQTASRSSTSKASEPGECYRSCLQV